MAQRSCEWCGEEFDTLSESRLHECSERHEKMADKMTLTSLGYTNDGDPLVIFNVEIPEGEEYGQYQLALGYEEKNGEERFVFLDGENNIISRLKPRPEVIEWLDTALDENCYVTATNYEPGEEYGDEDVDIFTFSGRALGQEFDHVDREDFTSENRQRVKQIRESLAGPRGEATFEKIDEGETQNFRDPLDTTDSEPVVEFVIAGNPEREPRVIETKENAGGLSKMLLVKHGFEIEANRPINAVPLTPDIGRTYVRLVFDDEEQAVDYFENFESLPPTDEMVRTVMALTSVKPGDLSQ